MSSPPASSSAARILCWIAYGLGTLVLAVLLCEWLGWPFLKRPIERALSQGLQREVSLGQEFKLRLFGSVRVATDALRIGPPANMPGPDFTNARDARLELPYSTVLALKRGERDGPLQVRRLEVGELDVTLLRTADGSANWQFGKRRDAETEKRPLDLPEFESLVVHDGKVRVDDAVAGLRFTGSVRTREGSAQAGAPPAATVAARASAPGAAPASAAAPAPVPDDAAGLAIEAKGSYREAPLTLSLRSSGVLPLATSRADTPAVPMSLRVSSGKTRIEVDGSARDVLRLAALEARFLIEGPSLAAVGSVIGATLPATAPFGMRGRLRKDGPAWQADVERLTAGESRLAGEFRYDTGPAVPVLTGRLTGERLALADLAPAFGAKPKQEAKPKAARKEGDRLLPQRQFNLPALGRMNADLRLALASVQIGGGSAVQDFAPLDGHLKLQDEVLTITDLLARTSGGELRGSLSLDARRETRPQWQADLRWSGVRLERFVKARNTRLAQGDAKARTTRGGQRPNDTGYVGGVLGGTAKLQGSGRSIAELAASLDGNMQAWVADGRVSHLLVELSGIDLAESLGLVVSGDEMLDVRCAVARVSVRDGLLQPEVAVVDTPDTTVLVGGQASLAKERLDLKLTAKPKDATLVALRSPVHVEGSLAKPAVRLEKGPMALKLGAAAALAAINPLAALLPLIDLGEPQRAVCSDALKGLQGPVPKRLQNAQGSAR